MLINSAEFEIYPLNIIKLQRGNNVTYLGNSVYLE